MKNLLRITALLALAALPAAAASFAIQNTGGAAKGAVDPNWLLDGGTVYVTFDNQYPFFPGPWLPNTVNSSWISPQHGYDSPPVNDAPGTYTYSTTFDLTGLNPNSALLSFVVAADNELTDVVLNGVSQGMSYASLSAFSGLFTLNSDFVAGVNTIEFVTENVGQEDTPAGLRVEFSQATAVDVSHIPEPGSIALLGFGAILLFSRRFRTAK